MKYQLLLECDSSMPEFVIFIRNTLLEKKDNMNRLQLITNRLYIEQYEMFTTAKIRLVNNSTRILNGFLHPIPSPTLRHFRQTHTPILMRCFWPFFFSATLAALAACWIPPVGPGCTGLAYQRGGRLQEFQSVNDVLRSDRQVFVATATLFGLWLGL